MADEGVGIPAENLERVFDPDFSTGGGMGLGLAIVRGIVEGTAAASTCSRRRAPGPR